MEKTDHQSSVKRTQKDYTLIFKLQVVGEVERGELSIKGALRRYGIQSHSTVLRWIEKYGNFDRDLHVKHMSKTNSPTQRIFELEQKLKVLERQKAFLERELDNRDQKAIMFDAIVEVVKEDYNIDLLKKVTPERCAATSKKEVKA